MGSCASTDTASSAVDQPPTAAKVITLAGALREYPSHLTAAAVLAGNDSSCFLCNSDKLFCDDYIPPLDPEEPLRPGRLYFVLPSAKLRYPLSRSDMKELAVKASSALALASEKGSLKKKKKEKVRIVPVLEVEGGRRGGGGDMDGVRRFDNCKVNQLGQRSVTVHRRMKRSRSVRGRVGVRCRCSSGGRLSTIPEVAEGAF